MNATIKEEDINSIRNYTRNGRPFGDESFTEKMEQKLDRIFQLRPRGRPKKGKANKWDVSLIFPLVSEKKRSSILNQWSK